MEKERWEGDEKSLLPLGLCRSVRQSQRHRRGGKGRRGA